MGGVHREWRNPGDKKEVEVGHNLSITISSMEGKGIFPEKIDKYLAFNVSVNGRQSFHQGG